MNQELYKATVVMAGIIFFFLLLRRFVIGKNIIKSPKLGFFNLNGEKNSLFLIEDKNAVAWLFSSVQESLSTPPQCDVLFLYCDLGAEGQILGSNVGLRDIIRDSGARIVVIASENLSENYQMALSKPTSFGQANLVLTLDRRGEIFSTFFGRLFSCMIKKGASMPMAWVTLAPQIPGHEHSDCPGTIFIAEVGQVEFR